MQWLKNNWVNLFITLILILVIGLIIDTDILHFLLWVLVLVGALISIVWVVEKKITKHHFILYSMLIIGLIIALFVWGSKDKEVVFYESNFKGFICESDWYDKLIESEDWETQNMTHSRILNRVTMACGKLKEFK